MFFYEKVSHFNLKVELLDQRQMFNQFQTIRSLKRSSGDGQNSGNNKTVGAAAENKGKSSQPGGS